MTKIKITITVDKSDKYNLINYIHNTLKPVLTNINGTMKIRGVKDDKTKKM